MPLQGDVPELARLAPQHEKVVDGPLEVGRGSPWAEDLDRLEIREQDPTKRVRELGLDNRVAVVAADDKAVEAVEGAGLSVKAKVVSKFLPKGKENLAFTAKTYEVKG